MSVWFSVLGSGSKGNATLLSFESDSFREVILLDAGLSPREVRKRMDTLGLAFSEISSILLTHLDSDHFKPSWKKICQRENIPIYLHQKHFRELDSFAQGSGVFRPFAETFSLGSLSIEFVDLPHDRIGSCGFVLDFEGRRIGFATDLGSVPDRMLELFCALDLLLIESNYDPYLQKTSPRPAFLKRRVMGLRGHLSNQQALDAVLHISKRSKLQQVVFLHLSEQCNRHDLIHRLYQKDAPHLLEYLSFSQQRQPMELSELPSTGQVYKKPLEQMGFQF